MASTLKPNHAGMSRLQRARQERPLIMELLEDRALPTCVLGAGASFNASTGTVSILGTNKSDVIDIQKVDPATPADASDDLIVATIRGKQIASCSVVDVQKLVIDGGNRSDRVAIGEGIAVATTVLGGNGNDRIEGGDGDDSIDGGNGKDNLRGDDGDDVVRGGNDNDVIEGDEGDDDLFGDEGKDRLEGGDDDDELHGGLGNDVLDGGEFEVEHDAHSDLLDGDEGENEVDDGVPVDLDDIETEFEAQLTGPTGATGEADFEKEVEFEDGESDLEVEFSVGVENAPANLLLDVFVNGVLVGQISSDSEGEGQLHFSSEPDSDHGDDDAGEVDESEQQPFPPGFPEIVAGSTIEIKVHNTGAIVLQGTFVAENEVEDD